MNDPISVSTRTFTPRVLESRYLTAVFGDEILVTCLGSHDTAVKYPDPNKCREIPEVVRSNQGTIRLEMSRVATTRFLRLRQCDLRQPGPTKLSMLSVGVCENRDGWLVAWGFCG